MVGPQRLFADGEGALVQRLGLGIICRSREGKSEVVQNHGIVLAKHQRRPIGNGRLSVGAQPVACVSKKDVQILLRRRPRGEFSRFEDFLEMGGGGAVGLLPIKRQCQDTARQQRHIAGQFEMLWLRKLSLGYTPKAGFFLQQSRLVHDRKPDPMATYHRNDA